MPKTLAETAADIRATKFLDEDECVARLRRAPYSAQAAQQIKHAAGHWVQALREETENHTLLDTFLSEYGLSNEEGVALMCLAEAFLRIPDADTAELLVQEKLADRDWAAHLGQADSWLVNSSTWALMLTGNALSLDDKTAPGDWFEGLVAKLSLPIAQRAVGAAMQILGKEFVLGETIGDALRNCTPGADTAYSFDMLGEGARDRASSARYLAAYQSAIVKVGATPAIQNNSVSIKLSALHPRYESLQEDRSGPELLRTLQGLVTLARKHDVPLSIDAEESERLQFSLNLFAQLCHSTAAWDGLGLVVQAYGKRAPLIIDWLAVLARDTHRRIPVRLVKGAYWDAEIKRAQEQGLAEYPVYTRKATTDAAYLHCARKLLDQQAALSPQFATHNAHTVAGVLNMANSSSSANPSSSTNSSNAWEFQRLHGMGEHLYEVVRRDHPNLTVRVYAPVGKYTDLLAYLVRRLLENGANSSFTNRLLDAELPIESLLQDPFDLLATRRRPRNPNIVLPMELYGKARVNSVGLDLSDPEAIAQYWSELPQPLLVQSVTEFGSQPESPERINHTSPADSNFSLGQIELFPVSAIDAVFQAADQAQPGWDALGGDGRAQVLEKFSDLLEASKADFYALLCAEAGKTIADCVSEVREAIDFCRYYAAQGREQFAEPTQLPGPTGECNQLSLQGRGVFVCISPWNFPLAIFIGQVSAALMAGNAVIAKPADRTPRIAQLAIELLHRAGLPPTLCQLLLGSGKLGAALVGHHHCAGVAFTGSMAVAKEINRQLAMGEGPIRPLIAETGGQNAMLVDSTALLEQVTDDVVRSAFMSSGQRCSALRVLCLQEEIADASVAMIRGAMDELFVGHPQHIGTDMGPIISREAVQALESHIEQCRSSGFNIYQPELTAELAGNYLAPTLIEIGALADLTAEHFGPILHILRYDAEAIDTLMADINATGFGLTFGIHTRLEARADKLAAASRAGNVYINRNMVGAVVGTQPFGGQGLSGTGPKAGGPYYLARFAVEKTVTKNTTATGGNLALLAEPD
jgi:RHH-type proline utilization regulon transcriptional repressor/proline dehydrogenase/delta 1-pyrroline-5-carboxylate dehydrogenase